MTLNLPQESFSISVVSHSLGEFGEVYSSTLDDSRESSLSMLPHRRVGQGAEKRGGGNPALVKVKRVFVHVAQLCVPNI